MAYRLTLPAAAMASLLCSATTAPAMNFEPPQSQTGVGAQPSPAPNVRRPVTPSSPPRQRVTPNPADPNVLVDERSRCAAWVPDPQPGEAIQWSGGCGADGMASGPGELLRVSNGRTLYLYQGQFAGGRMVGPGTRIAANGDRMEAEFREGRANGQGTIRYNETGRHYEGMLRDDLPHGRGTMTSRTGAKFEGDWIQGRRSGQGTMVSHEGRYSGEWRNDVRHGRGRMTYAVDGSVYEGEWAQDMRDGQGTYNWVSMDGHRGIYTGAWRRDRRNGPGQEVFVTQNAQIEGNFVDDRPQGLVIYVAGQQRFEGELQDGCLRMGGTVHRILAGSGECR